MDSHSARRSSVREANSTVAALRALLGAITAAADVPQPAGDDWTAYNAVCRLRLWSIRHATEGADVMPASQALALAQALATAAAAPLPYKPDLSAAPKVLTPAADDPCPCGLPAGHTEPHAPKPVKETSREDA